MNHKVRTRKFDKTQAIEQFERYKETGKGSIIEINQNKLGYSSQYAEGWSRIFGKDKLDEEESQSEKDLTIDTDK